MVAKSIERQAAIASGQCSYFTGKPCKNGHIAPRQTSNGECHECARLRQEKFREANPEKAREIWTRYREANRDKRRAQFAEWYAKNWTDYAEKNRDRLNQHSRNFRERNPERRKEILKLHYDAHKEEKAAYGAAYYALKTKDPDWKQQKRERSNQARAKFYKAKPEIKRLHDARRRGAPGQFTSADIAEIRHRQNNRCANPLCRKEFGALYDVSGFHIDHIKPIVRGGSNDPSNLQLLCPPCNGNKGAKDNIEWLQSLGLLI